MITVTLYQHSSLDPSVILSTHTAGIVIEDWALGSYRLAEGNTVVEASVAHQGMQQEGSEREPMRSDIDAVVP